ncbi:MAG: diguanylate cyclase [Proteobacteria bacterium]|nr:diguanylate cyclase [Pseudomonadota bacterium]
MRIRFVILVAICLSLAPFLVGQILLAEKNMSAAVTVAEQSLRLSLLRAENLFREAQMELQNLSSTIALIDSLRYNSPELCSQTLRKIVDAHERVKAIALLTPQGMAYCSSEPKAIGGSVSERQYFADSLRSQGIVWGDLQVSKVTGQIIIASARAVRRDADVSFVVLVTLDVAALKRQTFQQFQLPIAQAALMTGQGRILDVATFDKDAPPFDSQFLERARRTGTGVMVPDTHDARSTFLGVIKLPMADGRIVFSVPIGQIYAEAFREMITAVALVCLEAMVIAACLFAALEFLILRSLRRMTDFASHITAGDRSERMTIRSPFPEFSVLSSALNLMVDRLDYASFTDALTGLSNRRALEVHLDRCGKRLDAEGIHFAVAMIDIDHFKFFNDRFGHSTGDSVLQMVGDALRRFAKPDEEAVARYGGEEFTFILSDARPDRVAERLEMLRRSIEDMDIPHPDSRHGRVTVSIGFAITRIGGSAREALDRADAALYAAKARGRNRVESEARPVPPLGAVSFERPREEAMS